jgi:dihydrofolate reductase
MRSLVLYQLLSLDGVAEEPGDWLFDTGEEIFANLAGIIATQDDVLLGRGTYDYWVDYWPTSDVEPFATFINTTPKHVVTSTALTSAWANSSVVPGSALEFVAELKDGDGGDIGVHGSITLARTLLGAGLVDRIHLVMAPNLAGGGARLFDEKTGAARMHLDAVEADLHGNLFVTYSRLHR